MALLALFLVSFLAAYTYKGRLAEEPLAAVASGPLAVTENDLARTLGKSDAELTLLYYIDYDCPYCKTSLPMLKVLIEDHPEVRAIVRPFPLIELHPEAYGKAVLAECLAQAGEDFFKISETLFEMQGTSIEKIAASSLGIRDEALLKECRENTDAQTIVHSLQSAAIEAGLYTTPSIILIRDDEVLAKGNYVSKEKLTAILAPFLPVE